MPAWLINDGADATSEAMYGLSAYVRAEPAEGARRASISNALPKAWQIWPLSNNAATWPFGAILP